MPCGDLRKLYLKDKSSLIQIAKKLGFSSRTISIRANECMINMRNPGPSGPKISNKTLEYLYLKKRLSSRKIAKLYDCAYSCIDSRIRKLGLPVKTLAAAHITTSRHPFSGNLSERAYLTGFSIGDLRVRKVYKNSETILIDCGSTKKEQIRLIKGLFGKYGRVWISKPKENGKTQIECGLNLSFSFLLGKFSKFPTWVSKSRKLILFAIAGFSDAEGSFFIGKNGKYAGFAIGNYNQTILKQINEWLHNLRFKTRLCLGVKKGYTGKDGYIHQGDYWILSITVKYFLLKFTRLILPYLKHKDKIVAAKKVIKNINFRNKKYGYRNAKMLNLSHA